MTTYTMNDAIVSIYNKCSFLHVTERISYVTLKISYKIYAATKSLLSNSNYISMPLANMITLHSQTFKKSFRYRGVVLWNQLPKDWNNSALSYSKFKEVVFNWIVKKRNVDYVSH